MMPKAAQTLPATQVITMTAVVGTEIESSATATLICVSQRAYIFTHLHECYNGAATTLILPSVPPAHLLHVRFSILKQSSRNNQHKYERILSTPTKQKHNNSQSNLNTLQPADLWIPDIYHSGDSCFSTR